MNIASPSKSDRVRALNDHLRRTFTGGLIVVTAGVHALPDDLKARALRAVREFQDFDEGNDPYHEHDFASLNVEGTELFFKLDYYDRDMRFHSPDPADPEKTRRVLTVMLASEY